MISVHSGEDDASEVKPDEGASEAPPFSEDPETIAPGDSTTLSVEFSADFEFAKTFSWHEMSTVLWMDGKIVDEVEDLFYVVPSNNWIPGLSDQTLSTNNATETTGNVAISTGASGQDALTATNDEDLYGEPIPVISGATLTPDQPEETESYTISESINSAVFLLSSVSGADIHLHTRDGQDRHVGFDPATDSDQVEIPGASYNGSDTALEVISIPATEADTLTVEASARSFTSGQPVSVSVK